MLVRYLLILSLTILIEGCVAYLAGLRKRDALLAVAAINGVTHPALNTLILLLCTMGIEVTLGLVAILEVLVVVVEWRLLVYTFGRSSGRFLIVSLLGNGASFLIGWLLFWT